MESLSYLPSYAQDRLWLLSRMHPDDPSYNQAGAFRLTGPLDIGALHRAAGVVVRRHEVLRTTFRPVGGQLVQSVAPDADIPLPVEDLSGLEAVSRGVVLRQRLGDDAREIFDLERGPLFLLRLFRLTDREHVLLIRVHHIVSDGWSLMILLAELGSAYASGGRDSLPEPPIQYADFAAWQRSRPSEQAQDRQLEYWRHQLAGAPPALRLPADHAYGPAGASRGARYEFAVPGELAGRLRDLARDESATLFMGLLAGFTLLLRRYGRRDDIVIGTPVAGRDRPELESLIGAFVNTLALRISTEGDPTFRQLLRRVREACLGGFEHAAVPFERIVADLRPSRDPDGSPFFRVLFVLHNTPPPVLRLAGLRVRQEPVPALPVPFDLVASLIEHDGGLTGRLDYAAELFDEARIARMAGHFQTLLAAAAAGPDDRSSRLPLLTDAEQHRLTTAWNRTRASRADRCLHDLVAEQARRRPHAVAVTDGTRQLTYAELTDRAGRLGRHLGRLGVGPDVVVGVFLNRCADLAVVLLGVLAAGGAYLPLDPAYPDARLRFLVEDASPRVIVTSGTLGDRLPSSGQTVLRLDRDAAAIMGEPLDPAPGRLPAAAARVSPGNLAYVIYTSGSTGTPNGVLISHANVVRLLKTTASRFAFGPADVWLLFHSFAFDFSVWELWGALLHGGRAVMIPQETAYSPDVVLDVIRREQVTVLNQTPSAFAQLDRADEAAGTPRLALRWVIFGGEALDPRALRGWFRRRGHTQPRLVNMYGITETTVHVTAHSLDPADLDVGVASPIGTHLPDLRTLVLDEAMNPVPVGMPGELYVGGPGLARGYLNRPRLTGQRFLPDPFTAGARLYRTGDLVRWRDGGALEFIGRIDDQVKIRGYRIEPAEVQAVLAAHPAVREAAVVAGDDGPGDRRLIGYVVPAGAAAGPDQAQLRAFASERLPGYLVPSAFVLLSRLPLTAHGKLDRAALPDAGRGRPSLSAAFEAARTPAQDALALIWAEVLGLEEVGVHDDFLELGGQSLQAVELTSRIGEEFGVHLPVRAIFEHPTVADISSLLPPAAGSRPPAVDRPES